MNGHIVHLVSWSTHPRFLLRDVLHPCGAILRSDAARYERTSACEYYEPKANNADCVTMRPDECSTSVTNRPVMYMKGACVKQQQKMWGDDARNEQQWV